MYRLRPLLVIAAGVAMASLSPGQGPSPLRAAQPPGPPATNAGTRPPRKLALLVGISRYERPKEGKPSQQPPDWWNLNCQNDLDRLNEILIRRFQFDQADILILANEKATRQGIVNAFERHLIGRAQPGDLVYFHYSGHGQQIADDNGDEFDGLDESLVTADYKSQSAQDAYFTNLRDDKIGELLKQLKGRMTDRADGQLKGNITLTFDCCFSGTATRGEAPSGRLVHRGRGWNSQFDGPKPPPPGRGNPDSDSGLLDQGEALAYGYVLLTATRNDQTAKEKRDEGMNPLGAFTFYLLRALDQATPRTTYRDIYERVNAELTGDIPEQNPTIEGEANSLLFSGTAVPPEPYVAVQGFDPSNGTVRLPTGKLQGVTLGSRYAIYDRRKEINKPENLIARVDITDVQTTSCLAALQGERNTWPDPAALPGAKAVEIQRNYGENALKVWLDRVSEPVAQQVRKLQMLSTADVNEGNYEVRVRPSGSIDAADTSDARKMEPRGFWMIERQGGSIRRFDAGSDATPKMLMDTLVGDWKWKFVATLRNDSPETLIAVDLRLVPVEPDLTPTGKLRGIKRVRDDIKPVGNKLTVKDGDYVMLEVRNASERREAYITVLNVTPAGAITCAFPDPGEVPKFEAKPEEWVSLKRYVFKAVMRTGAAVETDTYKAIGTRESADFSTLLFQPPNPEGEREVRGAVANHRGGGNHGLARLIGLAKLGEDPDPNSEPAQRPPKMRGDRLTVEISDWSTADFILETVKTR
jgi:hypothetical protein